MGKDAYAASRGIAVGIDASATGTNGIAIGINAKTPGNEGIAIGNNANAGAFSIAIGRIASASSNGTAVGNGAYASSYSTALGRATYASSYGTAIGNGAFAGSNSTAIGSSTSAIYSNSTAIGRGASTTASNQIVLGRSYDTVYIPGKLIVGSYSFLGLNLPSNSSAIWTRATNRGNSGKNGWLYDKEGVGWHFASPSSYSLSSAMNYSDRRMKDIIGENLDAMDKINRIKVYDFTFKKDDLKTPHVGVIAQELQKIFPNAVTKDENGYLQIRHEDMFYAMINALKELDAKIKQIALQLADNIKIVASDSEKIRDLTIRVNNQDKEIKAQNKKLFTQEKEIAALKKEIADLKQTIRNLPH